jgi:hypothetical protein
VACWLDGRRHSRRRKEARGSVALAVEAVRTPVAHSVDDISGSLQSSRLTLFLFFFVLFFRLCSMFKRPTLQWAILLLEHLSLKLKGNQMK